MGRPFVWDTKTIRHGLNFTLTTTVGDIAAQKFTSPDGTATVASAEPHYLLRMEAQKKGTMDFSDWNKPATVTGRRVRRLTAVRRS